MKKDRKDGKKIRFKIQIVGRVGMILLHFFLFRHLTS